MKNGKCPQCGSASVHAAPSGVSFGNMDRVFVDYGKSHQPSTYTAYVCVACGLVEIHLATTYLAEIAQSWSHVPVKG